MKFLFFDINPSFVRAYEKALYSLVISDGGLEFSVSDVRQIPADVFVSPANSYGAMDGGIDEVYMEMFPGVEERVQAAIAKHGLPDRYRTAHLPVGSALAVGVGEASTGSTPNMWLLVAPTMTRPSSIRKSPGNVYYAMLAILYCAADFCPGYATVAIPCLGTGVGGLSAEESAAQVRQAFLDFQTGKARYPAQSRLFRQSPGIYVRA